MSPRPPPLPRDVPLAVAIVLERVAADGASVKDYPARRDMLQPSLVAVRFIGVYFYDGQEERHREALIAAGFNVHGWRNAFTWYDRRSP